MAIIEQWSEEKTQAWKARAATFPHHLRALAESFPPNKLFRHKHTGYRVTVCNFANDGRHVAIKVTGKFNLLPFNYVEFEVPIEDLVECDAPGPQEEVGELIKSGAEILIYMAELTRQMEGEPS